MLDVRGAIPGSLWPAVPTPHGAHLLALLYQLEQADRLSADGRLARQFHQLGAVVEHARRTVPFYGPRLAAAGVDPGRPLTPEAFVRLPPLAREEVQLAGAALHSGAVPPEHGGVTRHLTAGSTGKPVAVLLTGLTDLFWQAFTLRDHLRHGRDFAGSLAAVRLFADDPVARPGGAAGPNWGYATEHLVDTGPVALLDIRTPVAQQFEWLSGCDPDYLLTYPSNLQALAEQALRSGRRGRLREARTFGEVLGPEVRAAVRAAWGVPVVDTYSCQELGYLALQAPGGTHYEVQHAGVYLEVLRDDGSPCGPGEVGRVVATGLHNFAMPLLRYEVGDYAEVGERPGELRRVLGRRRQMFTMPDGSRRWPTAALPEEARGAEFPPLRQYQVVQTAPGRCEMRLAVYRPLSPAEEETLRGWLRAGLRCPELEVAAVYVDEIPRGPGGKYEEFVSRVAPEPRS